MRHVTSVNPGQNFGKTTGWGWWSDTWNWVDIDLSHSIVCLELAKQVCPRLRELAPAAGGGITSPRTDFFGHLCTYVLGLSNCLGSFSNCSRT